MLVKDLSGLTGEMAEEDGLAFTIEFFSEFAAEMEKRAALYNKEGKRKLARFVSQIVGALHCLAACMSVKKYAGGQPKKRTEFVYGYTPVKLCGDLLVHFSNPGGSMGEFFLILGSALDKDCEMYCKTVAAHLKQAQKMMRKYHEEKIRRAKGA